MYAMRGGCSGERLARATITTKYYSTATIKLDGWWVGGWVAGIF